MPNELKGTALHAGNLSDEEGRELYALLELRHLPGTRPSRTRARCANCNVDLDEREHGRPVCSNCDQQLERELAAYIAFVKPEFRSS